MTDRYAYLDKLDGEVLRAEIIRLARTQGARVAFKSAMEIAADKNAASQARSNAQRTLLTLAGMLDHRDRSSGVKKDPSEMDGIELQEALQQMLIEQRAILEAPPPGRSAGEDDTDSQDEDDIFG